MAEVTRYVNTASTAGGDGTTNATTGATRAYATLAEWEAAEATNLVTAGDSHTVKCCGTTADASATVKVDSSWTTGASNTITIEGNSDESDGPNTGYGYSTSHYRLDSSGDSSMLNVSVSYTTVRNIQVRRALASKNNSPLFDTNTTSNLTISGLFLIMDYAEDGIGDVGSNNVIENCVVVSTVGAANDCAIKLGISAASGTTIYNCTVMGFDDAVHLTDNSATVKNCCVFNSPDNDILTTGGSPTIDYNATDDLDGTNTQDMSPGGTESDGWNDALNDYTTYNFGVKDTASVLHETGLGNASDSNVPTIDIRGVARSTTAPSIGAYEYSPPTFIPRIMVVM